MWPLLSISTFLMASLAPTPPLCDDVLLSALHQGEMHNNSMQWKSELRFAHNPGGQTGCQLRLAAPTQNWRLSPNSEGLATLHRDEQQAAWLVIYPAATGGQLVLNIQGEQELAKGHKSSLKPPLVASQAVQKVALSLPNSDFSVAPMLGFVRFPKHWEGPGLSFFDKVRVDRLFAGHPLDNGTVAMYFHGESSLLDSGIAGSLVSIDEHRWKLLVFALSGGGGLLVLMIAAFWFLGKKAKIELAHSQQEAKFQQLASEMSQADACLSSLERHEEG